MKNETKTNNVYLKHLSDSFCRMQNEMIDYVTETDYNSPAEILDCICFFNSLKKKCTELLPEYYVKNVVLISDSHGTVRSIKYEYYAPGEGIATPGIRVFSDSYSDKKINSALNAAV